MSPGAVRRVGALMRKDLAELVRHPGALVPAIAMSLASLVPAFLVAIVAPGLSGESLSDAEEFATAAEVATAMLPELASLEGAALVQAFLFHQFGLLILMVPVVGSMAIAAHAVIGEKTARTLEPLLATPISTLELLAAKTMTPFVFSLAVLWATLGLYLAGMATLAEAEVWRAFLGRRTFVLFVVLGPLVTLVALLLAVIISSRVNDPRTAQQLGAFIVLPITLAFLGQLFGQFVVGMQALVAAAAGMVVLALLLLWVGARVFDRERILMRWK
jgi:ABC-2 type transport system permease protein